MGPHFLNKNCTDPFFVRIALNVCYFDTAVYLQGHSFNLKASGVLELSVTTQHMPGAGSAKPGKCHVRSSRCQLSFWVVVPIPQVADPRSGAQDPEHTLGVVAQCSWGSLRDGVTSSERCLMLYTRLLSADGLHPLYWGLEAVEDRPPSQGGRCKGPVTVLMSAWCGGGLQTNKQWVRLLDKSCTKVQCFGGLAPSMAKICQGPSVYRAPS